MTLTELGMMGMTHKLEEIRDMENQIPEGYDQADSWAEGTHFANKHGDLVEYALFGAAKQIRLKLHGWYVYTDHMDILGFTPLRKKKQWPIEFKVVKGHTGMWLTTTTGSSTDRPPAGWAGKRFREIIE